MGFDVGFMGCDGDFNWFWVIFQHFAGISAVYGILGGSGYLWFLWLFEDFLMGMNGI